MDEVTLIERSLSLTDARLIFGPDEAAAKEFYRTLARIVHPDTGGNTEAFQALQTAWDNWEVLMDANTEIFIYGDEVSTSSLEGRFQKKTLRNPNDSDLMLQEQRALNEMENWYGATYFEQLYPHLEHIDRGGREHLISLRPPELLPHHLVPLEEFVRFYRGEYDLLYSVGWIWHKLVRALTRVHRYGLLHMGITPKNIMIGPKHHDVIVSNWYYSSLHRELPIAAPIQYLGIYPPDMQRNDINTNTMREYVAPGLDIYMAAGTMLEMFRYLMPPEMVFYFETMTVLPIAGVPTDLEALINNFDDLIYRILGWRQQFVNMPWVNWDEYRNEVR